MRMKAYSFLNDLDKDGKDLEARLILTVIALRRSNTGSDEQDVNLPKSLEEQQRRAIQE